MRAAGMSCSKTSADDEGSDAEATRRSSDCEGEHVSAVRARPEEVKKRTHSRKVELEGERDGVTGRRTLALQAGDEHGSAAAFRAVRARRAKRENARAMRPRRGCP